MIQAARSIVLLVPGSLQTRTGGYEYDRRIVRGLRQRGWTVEVCELDSSFPQPTASARAEAVATLASISSGTILLADGLAFGALADEAAREARRLRFVALVHHPLATETGLSDDAVRELASSERRALASARLVVVTSPATARGLGPYGVEPARLVIVEPGTDPAPLARGTEDGPVHLLCVASLTPRKGHEVLFRALARLDARQWRLACVGSLDRDRAAAEHVIAQAREAGITDRVSFSGELEGEPLAAAYDGADVFVLATWHEGYGMAVAEALARGLPVVSTAVGAIGDLVGTTAGILVSPGDVDALADALGRVIEDKSLRSRLAAGARHNRQHLQTWDGAVEKIAKALERIAE